MPNNYPSVNESDLTNLNTFGKYVSSGVVNESSGTPLKTSASVSGTPQYAATSMSVSDILQGTFSVSDPSDTLSVINKGLTQDLAGLYNVGADKVSTFGSGTLSSAITNPQSSTGGTSSTGGGANSGSIMDNPQLSQLNESWVNTLPTINPSGGGIIWQKNGKASHEMHLPTSPDLATDISQHKQYTDLAPNNKHPWFMDRVGGPIGGGNVKINTDPTTGTILSEDASTAGQNGAFGYLDPASEQFYMSMAWPYKGAEKSFTTANRQDIVDKIANLGLKQSDYKGKKILVYSTETKRGCVCTPGDWGSQPYWSNGAVSRSSINGFYYGLSPDAHQALGTAHGATIVVGWVADDTPLGPYAAQSSSEGVVPSNGSSTKSGLLSGAQDYADATGSSKINTFDEMRYAGQMIVNHANCWMKKSPAFIGTLTAGFAVIPSNVKNVDYYDASTGRGYLLPSLLNFMWYIMEGGFVIDNYLGSYGIKQKLGDATQLSNHAKGGAIDIGNIGRASDNITYQLYKPECRPVADSLFTYLGTLPKGTKPEEIGCAFAADYPGLHVYKDPNPTHIHLGFDSNQAGQLITALKPRPGTLVPATITINGTVN